MSVIATITCTAVANTPETPNRNSGTNNVRAWDDARQRCKRDVGEVDEFGRGSGICSVVCGDAVDKADRRLWRIVSQAALPGHWRLIEYRDFFRLAEYGLQLLNI